MEAFREAESSGSNRRMLIRLQLSFESNLVFRGFLPETTEAGLHLSLADGKYLVILYMPDRKKQSGNVTDIPSSPDELKHYVELFCRGLTMDVEVTRIDPQMTADLEAGRTSEKTEEFGAELCEVVIDTFNRLVDYCRNIVREYWLDPVRRSPYVVSGCQLQPTVRVVQQIREVQTLGDTETINEEHVSRFLETRGLRGTFDEIVRFVSTEVGVALEDVTMAREAINERNLVLHSAKRSVDIETARSYVSAIDQLLLSFRELLKQFLSFPQKRPGIGQRFRRGDQ